MAATSVNSKQIRDEEVKRADLNVSTSGSAVIAKAIAGTGLTLSSTGPDAGTGDVTISTNMTTAALVDLSGAAYFTVIDEDVADTLITDTSKPANPQYARQILSGNIPSATDITEWMILIAICGKNNDISTRTINAMLTINGTELGSSSNTTIATTKFWRYLARYISAPLAVNDTIGVKMWASAISLIDYRAVTIYIVPRNLGPGTAKGICIIRNTITATVTGAVAGVTYPTNSLGTPVIYDTTAAIVTNANAPNIAAMTGESILQNANTLDGGVTIAGSDSVLTNYALSINRYLRRLTLAS